MDRRRPVPGGDNFRRASNVPIIISMKSASPSNDRPSSIISTDKALPPAPPEMQSANDRVAYLTARLDSLAHRRNNINKSIKQMTELMPTDRLLSNTDVIRKREIEKKKVEGLKEELAEIQREEHDLGLKLYRANKRLEREAAFEPSSLWVRRVTS
jgi:chromosome segregation ATPase